MFETLLKNVAVQLDQNKIPYMVIGGQAVLLYGSPRLTKDIDITLGVDVKQFPAIKNICESLHLKILHEEPEKFAQETNVMPAEDPQTHIRVDFIFSDTDYEQQAMKRVKEVLLKEYNVKFASVEDILIHKMIAGRAVDEMDVKNILIKHKDTIDSTYLKHWLSEFSQLPEYNNIFKDFEQLLKSSE